MACVLSLTEAWRAIAPQKMFERPHPHFCNGTGSIASSSETENGSIPAFCRSVDMPDIDGWLAPIRAAMA
jgi:hypothetical protein